MLIKKLKSILDMKFVYQNQKGEQHFIQIMELRDLLFCTLYEEIDPFPEVSKDVHEEVQNALEICQETFDKQCESEHAVAFRDL